MKIESLFESKSKKKDEKTLYCSRKLLNGADLVEWAHEQGFDKCLDPKEMHVTIAYSKEKIDWSDMTDSFDQVTAKGGKRVMKLFGEKEDCVVLTFENGDLHERWAEFIEDYDASWDHDGYHPHVTISYAGLPEGMKLEDIKPYKGELKFGPEEMAEINPKWKGKVKEKKTKKSKVDEGSATHRSGSAVDTAARELIADVMKFGRSIGIVSYFRHPFAYAEGEIELTELTAKETMTGAGTKFMTYLTQRADDGDFNLFVSPSNARNKAFYMRFGFESGDRNNTRRGCLVRYAAMDDDTREEWEALRQQAVDRGDLEESKAVKLPATRKNIAAAKAFVEEKWAERAKERGTDEPADLSGSCKFTSMFAQAIFGGQLQGNFDHQHLNLDGKIIDLNRDAADVRRLGKEAHTHDESWWGNEDHIDSMESCKPRVKAWIKEFMARQAV